MLVGVPREIKDNEYRVGIVPSTVRELTENGHHVLIERQAGAGAGFGDGDYKSAGAEVVSDSDALLGRAELIVKVKGPLDAERKELSRGQVLFTYLHLAARIAWKKRMADAACYLPARRALPPQLSSSSAVVSQGQTRPRAPPAWEPMSRCLIAIRRHYAGLLLNWAAPCERCFRPATWWSYSAGEPTSLLLPCLCRAQPRQN